MFSLMWNLKSKTNEQTNLNRLRNREQTGGYQREEAQGMDKQMKRIKRYKLPANKINKPGDVTYTQGKQNYDHFIMYKNIEPLCYISETK